MAFWAGSGFTITLHGNADLGGLTLSGNTVRGHLFNGDWLDAMFHQQSGGVVQVNNLSPVPEPTRAALMLLGLGGMLAVVRRRRKQ